MKLAYKISSAQYFLIFQFTDTLLWNQKRWLQLWHGNKKQGWFSVKYNKVDRSTMVVVAVVVLSLHLELKYVKCDFIKFYYYRQVKHSIYNCKP